MMSIAADVCLLEKRKNYNKTLIKMDESDDEVVLRRKTVSFSDSSEIGTSASACGGGSGFDTCDNDDSTGDRDRINNINQITAILDIRKQGQDDFNELSSYTSNDLWRLDNFVILNQVQRNSFVHRNFNDGDQTNSFIVISSPTSTPTKDEQSTTGQIQQSQRPVSTPTTQPFRRETSIRQSWNNLWRKNKDKIKDKDKDKLKEVDDFEKEKDKLKVIKPKDKIKDSNNNSNKNGNTSASGGGGSGSSDTNDTTNILLEKAVSAKARKEGLSLFTKGHSRNSSTSSSSCASYR